MPRRNRTEIPCDYCGATLSLPPYRIAGSKHHYCSQECKAAAQSVPKPDTFAPETYRLLVCDGCGKAFTRHKYKPTLNRTYCSRECAALGYRKYYKGANHGRFSQISCQCDYCGKKISVGRRRYSTYQHHFCGSECASRFHSKNSRGPKNPRWKGGKLPYYGPNWQKQRRKARQRDGYRCQICGKSEKKLKRQLDVHHVIEFRVFGIDRYIEANQLTNLISLCASCHRQTEEGKIALQPPLL